MYSVKAIKAIMASHKPAIVEHTGYRLTDAQIKGKIEALRKRAERNPEDADDINAEIADLEAIISGKSDLKPKPEKVKNESIYLEHLARMNRLK